MDEMKSNAEIKQHKGLDVVRYSEIAGTKGLARERCGSHSADSETSQSACPEAFP